MRKPSYLRDKEVEEEMMRELAKNLNYDRDTGVFRWACRMSAPIAAGRIAGTICTTSGYRNFMLKQKHKIKAHRLAWFIVNGEAPSHCIDHIDGNRDNNAIANLRVVDENLNQQNRNCHRSGVLWGTAFHKATGRFGTRVKVGEKSVSLGYYDTREEAHEVAVRFARMNKISILGE